MKSLPTRDSYIDKKLTETREELGGVVYFGEGQGKWYAQGFSGRRTKPDFYNGFHTKEQMDKAIDIFFQGVSANIKYKDEQIARRSADAKTFLASLKPGVVLYDTWGYEQTNVEFFEVKSVSGNKVVIQELAHEDVGQTSWCSCKVIPKKGLYCGEPIEKIVKSNGIRIDSSVCLRLYDGHEVHKSWGY